MRNENRVCFSKNLNENLYATLVRYMRKEPAPSLPPSSLSLQRSSEKFFHFSTRSGKFLRGSHEGEDIRGIVY